MFQKSKIIVGLGDTETEGLLPFSLLAAATTNQTLVKDSPGALYLIHAINVNAAVRYLKFYNMAKTPTAGSGTPFMRFAIPASATGAGFVVNLTVPLKFSAGIAFTMTTGVADTDTAALTANDVILTLGYV